MSITAKDVNELRKKTGAGMMDCKKALQESNGNMESAIDFLRKKGQKIAAKRGDRDAKEGLVIAKSSGNSGYLVCLNCETDFVAKNNDFGTFANSLVDVAINSECSSLEELMNKNYPGSDLSVNDKITEQSGVIMKRLKFQHLRKLMLKKL